MNKKNLEDCKLDLEVEYQNTFICLLCFHFHENVRPIPFMKNVVYLHLQNSNILQLLHV